MMFLLRLLAPALIGCILLLSSAHLAVLFDACFYLASLLILSPSWVTGPWRRDEGQDRNILGELSEGWRCIRTSATLKKLLLLDFLTSLVGMASWSTAAAFLETVVHVPAANNGWIQASMGLSGALGTRFAVGLQASPRTLAWILTAIAGSYLCLAQCATLKGIVAVWFLRGLIIGIFVVLISQEMARQVPSEVMGRVQAAWDQVACLACFFGSMATPWLLRHAGAVGAFRLYALVMVVFTCLWWVRLWRNKADPQVGG